MYCLSVWKIKRDSISLKMGNSSIEVTEENLDAAQALKVKAMDALEKGMFQFFQFLMHNRVHEYFLDSSLEKHCVCVIGTLNEAIDYLTEAIILNPRSAILYATRGNFVL